MKLKSRSIAGRLLAGQLLQTLLEVGAPRRDLSHARDRLQLLLCFRDRHECVERGAHLGQLGVAFLVQLGNFAEGAVQVVCSPRELACLLCCHGMNLSRGTLSWMSLRLRYELSLTCRH